MNNDAILVIDDEPNNYEVIETLLSDENYDIYYANSGEEALAGLDTFNPAVILLDLTMPIMDGLEVCKRLKLMRKWKSIPIIMVTASSSKTVLSSCLAAGADDFINKPVDKLELRSRIKSMLRIKKQFDRIESLSKLQQQNISVLEQDLGSIGCDLAVGFANELNIPLTDIVMQLSDLESNIHELDRWAILDMVKSTSRSAHALEQLTHKCWLYLELALEKKQFYNGEFCNIARLIEQIFTYKSQLLDRQNDWISDVQNANVAMTNQHCEWIIKELLDFGFSSSHPGEKISIRGRAIDKLFHLSVSNYPHESTMMNIQSAADNPTLEEQELGLGLKIIKKIVDIYDGKFSISTVMSGAADPDTEDNSYHRTISVSLPLK